MTLKEKVTSRRGETLVETLAAILVVGLSSALFLTLITTGVRLSATGDAKMQQLNEALSIAEEADQDGGHAVTGQVVLTQAGQSDQTIDVTYYGDAGSLRSYRMRGGGDPP